MNRLMIAIAPIAAVVACSSSSTTPAGGTGDTAAAVQGATDTHCNGQETRAVDPSVCHETIDAGADGGMDTNDYGPTEYNSEGDDDDCKYHVKWTATKVAEGSDVTFYVVATNKKDGTPVAGTVVRAEVFLDDTHPAPNTKQASSESAPGQYGVGPIQFDNPGKWTVRFHFHEECNDSPTSPHGHAAFYVQVP